jgi:hypothetical protein
VSRTPARELARIKVSYPAWRTERRGDLYIATERNGRQRVITATSLGELENELIRIDWTLHTGREK